MYCNLRQIRRASGWTLEECVERGKSETHFPKSDSHLATLEDRGTRNVDKIRAFARVFSLPFDVVDEAARYSASDISHIE
jgi:hypothetical protein